AAKEVEFLNTYVTQGYAGIAISPISEEASLEPLRNAAKSGLAISLSNSNLGSEDWMIACYTSDNYQLGNLTGLAAKKYIEENLDGKAKIGILQYKSLLAEQSGQRYQGFVDALKDMEGVEIVADQDAWMQDKAITVAGDMLTSNPDIDILWAANEGGTVGAAMAIKNAGLAGKVVAFGTDASEQTIDLLQSEDNILQAVTGQDPYNIGIKTMKALIASLEGSFDQKGETIIVPGVVLTRENPEEVEEFKQDLMEKMAD
ncbi:MAG TPA: sugar ABC transporter substrate-binding protein, partial [Clostridiales bacterium]|nr:sugar ABC transporter substrate-binding protein [Clostridiales bacterium]